MTYHIIEPCCCERQLPGLMKAALDGGTVFTTNGDMTVNHLFKAVSSLAGISHTLTICTAKADTTLLRQVRRWIDRDWTKGVTLCTAADQTDLVAKELKDVLDIVTYAVDADLTEGVLIFEPTPEAVAFNHSPLTTPKTVIILGAMLSQKQPALHLYTAIATRNTDITEAITKPLFALLRTKAVNLTATEPETPTAPEPAAGPQHLLWKRPPIRKKPPLIPNPIMFKLDNILLLTTKTHLLLVLHSIKAKAGACLQQIRVQVGGHRFQVSLSTLISVISMLRTFTPNRLSIVLRNCLLRYL